MGMRKITVMIVDDEKLVIEDLKTLVDWEALGFEIAATAFNGRQALEKYKKLRPQVVFTDVRMPFMDGLELIRKIRELDGKACVFLLTAYEDFSYAQTAIKYGIKDYVIKSTLNEVTFTELLEELFRDIIQQTKFQDILREKQILEYLEAPEGQHGQELLSMYKKAYSYILAEQDMPVLFADDMIPESYVCPKKEICSVVKLNHIDGCEVAAVSQTPELRTLIVLDIKEISQRRTTEIIYAYARQVRQRLFDAFGVSFTVYAIDRKITFPELKRIYRQNGAAFRKKYLLGCGEIIWIQGKHMAGGNHMRTGDNMAGGNHMRTGDYMAGGNHMRTGDNMAGGNHMRTGDYMAGRSHMRTGDNMAGGNHMRTGDNMAGGNHMRTEDNMAGGNHMRTGGLYGYRESYGCMEGKKVKEAEEAVADTALVQKMIDQGNVVVLVEYLDRVYKDLEDSLDEKGLKSVSGELFMLLKRNYRHFPKRAGQDFSMAANICNWLDGRHIKKWFEEQFILLIKEKEQIFPKGYSRTTMLAIDYIFKHYQEHNLTIKDIAERVHLSAGHLCGMFKKETQKTLNSYLTEVRIEEAKKLLEEGGMKIYEVSSAVGYQSSQYFSQIFFKLTGTFPTDWQKRQQED